MQKLNVSYKNTHSKFVDFELTVTDINSNYIDFQLSAWRPGRYELQNFAKNVQYFSAEGEGSQLLKHRKISKDCWRVFTNGLSEIKVRYNYYADLWDAGGSWLNEHLLYLNWVNCALCVVGREEEPINVSLNIPDTFDVACGLVKDNEKTFTAQNYGELVDMPVMAGDEMQHIEYQVDNVDCHIWVYGNWPVDQPKIIKEFEAFTKIQFDLFGSYPFDAFHFMILALPHRYYHGVEHRNSTMIALGPAEEINHSSMYKEMLGVSSHELFHVWNIKQIRPKNLLPYNFKSENYFEEGYVAEGITSYYGDLLLAGSKVFTDQQFIDELNARLKRSALNLGRFNKSVSESSIDLWLDGYTAGIPNRKSSIYVEGCLVAFALDLILIRESKGATTLDPLMKTLWEDYAQQNKGYDTDDVISILEKLCDTYDFKIFFEQYVDGTEDLILYIKSLLDTVGCCYTTVNHPELSIQNFGMQLLKRGEGQEVVKIYPYSAAESVLRITDKIIAVDGKSVNAHTNPQILFNKEKVEVSFFREEYLRSAIICKGDKEYGTYPQIKLERDCSEEQMYLRKKWLRLN